VTGRSVPEWRGKTPDTKVPPHVRMRIFLAHDGRCYLTGRKIRPGEYWELEHKIALCNGGEHREGNMGPALADPHKVKTAEDVKLRAKVDRIRKRHMGIKKKSTFPCSKDSRFKKKINGRVELR
jgi:5-methylcytosine-specific restriction protein A